MRLVGRSESEYSSFLTPPIFLQDNGLKYLHYVDSASKFPVRSGLEDLPERIEMSLISEVATGTSAPPPNVLQEQVDIPPPASLVASQLSFSLLSAHEGSLADQIAPDQSSWADWTDGLNMLRRDGGHVASQETAGFVQALTEIGLKIKLLGVLSCLYPSIPPLIILQIYPEKWWKSPVLLLLVLHQPMQISSFRS
jgi:hypothetical protein